MRGTDATSSLLPSSSSSASSEKTTTRNVHGLAKVAGVSIFLACSAAAAVALRGPSGTINAAHVGAEQQQQQQTSTRPLGAATPEALRAAVEAAGAARAAGAPSEGAPNPKSASARLGLVRVRRWGSSGRVRRVLVRA